MAEPTPAELLQQARHVLDRTSDVHGNHIDPLQFNALRRSVDRVLLYLEERHADASGPARVPGEPLMSLDSPPPTVVQAELRLAPGQTVTLPNHTGLSTVLHNDASAMLYVNFRDRSVRMDPPATPTPNPNHFNCWLDELQPLCDALHPGPWELDSEELYVLGGAAWPVFTLETDDDGDEAKEASLAAARFAIAARDALPKLIAKVRELQERLEAARPIVKEPEHV